MSSVEFGFTIARCLCFYLGTNKLTSLVEKLGIKLRWSLLVSSWLLPTLGILLNWLLENHKNAVPISGCCLVCLLNIHFLHTILLSCARCLNLGTFVNFWRLYDWVSWLNTWLLWLNFFPSYYIIWNILRGLIHKVTLCLEYLLLFVWVVLRILRLILNNLLFQKSLALALTLNLIHTCRSSYHSNWVALFIQVNTLLIH